MGKGLVKVNNGRGQIYEGGGSNRTSTGILNANAAAETAIPIRGIELHHIRAYDTSTRKTALVRSWCGRVSSSNQGQLKLGK